jgi:hypothetical protein
MILHVPSAPIDTRKAERTCGTKNERAKHMAKHDPSTVIDAPGPAMRNILYPSCYHHITT